MTLFNICYIIISTKIPTGRNIMTFLLCDSAQNTTSVDLITIIISLIAALVGGLCTLLGNIIAVSMQNRNQRNKIIDETKVSVCLNYYEFLSGYIAKIDQIDQGFSNALKQCVERYFSQFKLNAYFSYYIAKKWLKNEHSKFVSTINKLIENKNIQQADLHIKIRESFVLEMENTLSLLN